MGKKLVAEVEFTGDFYAIFARESAERPFSFYKKFTDKKKDSLALVLFEKTEYFINTQKEFEKFKSNPENKNVQTILWLDYQANIAYDHFTSSANDYCTSLRIYTPPYDFYKCSINVWRNFNN